VNDEEKRRKAKESTHSKTPEEGFSMLVPREISFSVDILTQFADDIPTQPQQSDAEDDGADGNANIGQNGAEDKELVLLAEVSSLMWWEETTEAKKIVLLVQTGIRKMTLTFLGLTTVLSVMLSHVCGCSLVLTSSSMTGFITSK
jgi:hypothetical protein